MKRLHLWALRGLAGLLVLAALVPLYDRWVARRQARDAVAAARRSLADAGHHGVAGPLRCPQLWGPALLEAPLAQEGLASWGNVGGCGAGGGSTGGVAGARWIGRGVPGGLLDLQCMATLAYSRDNYYSTINTRVGTAALQKWVFGLNVPILFKAGGVDVLGTEEQAFISGFGDLSLEVSRKLGITNASVVTLTVNAPTGSWDAVRQGVVLPQHLQLGSGVLGVTGQFEHTVDRDWGLVLLGGTVSYGGWENSIGDFRGPTTTAYAHAGYMLGPLVPAAGVTLYGKFLRDRQRGEDKADDVDPLFLVVPSLSLEWSRDWLSVLLFTSTSFSYNGFEGASVSLGVATSLF